MFIFVAWKKMQAGATGGVAKFETCEACGTEYVYTLYRAASGEGTSLYMLDNEGARNRAVARAEQSLKMALDAGVDPVPCPECGHFSKAMVREARFRWHPWMSVPGAMVLFFGWIGVALLLIYCNAMLYNPGPVCPWPIAFGTILGVAVLIVFLPLARLLLSFTYDPHNESPDSRIKKGMTGGILRTQFDEVMTKEQESRRRRPL